MSKTINATSKREDYSRFIVHLTRNDTATFKNGATARENFISILKSRKIIATRPQCLYNKKLQDMPDDIQKKFNVSCFTEVPLSQIHLLTRRIEGRKIELESYGFVFSKEFITSKGGQPAIYINSYGQNGLLRKTVDTLFEEAFDDGNLEEPNWRILPFINAMYEKCDFSWEREWRFLKTLKFNLDDLICVILPGNREPVLKDKFLKSGVAVISPGWTYEQIILELSSQQRKTKRPVVEGQIIKNKQKL
ncbi:MAG: hypothetical protein WC209_16455 [Ignavibacteriaceae bacterium]|jgi:hypothetical protein